MQVYVYRGGAYERLGDFQARMLERYSRAELLRTLGVPPDDIRNSNKQCNIFTTNHALFVWLYCRLFIFLEKLYYLLLQIYKFVPLIRWWIRIKGSVEWNMRMTILGNITSTMKWISSRTLDPTIRSHGFQTMNLQVYGWTDIISGLLRLFPALWRGFQLKDKRVRRYLPNSNRGPRGGCHYY